MFDGSAWKEFGLSHKGNYTIFPFWMFIVVWSVFSYVLGSFCVIGFSSVSAPGSAVDSVDSVDSAVNSVPEINIMEEAIREEPRLEIKELPPAVESQNQRNQQNQQNQSQQNQSQQQNQQNQSQEHKRPRRGRKPVPGYYVRGIVKGKPKYVYYGTESPFDE